MYFYRIKKGTKIEEAAKKKIDSPKQWDCEDIQDFLAKHGIENESLCRDSSQLIVFFNIPEDIEGQFYKNWGHNSKGLRYKKAKVKSDINQEYLEICKKNNIKVYGWFDFENDCGSTISIFCNEFKLSKQGDEYFLSNVKYSWNDEALEEITEKEFLATKLKYME